LAHAETATLPPAERLEIGSLAGRLGVPGLLIGVGALAAAAWVSFHTPVTEAGNMTTHFFHAYLAAYAFFMAITLGSLAFIMIQHLTRAGWSVTVRRAAEGLSLNMFLMVIMTLVFFIPVNDGQQTLDGVHRLFPHWFVPPAQQHDGVLLAKIGYLTPRFFAIRMGAYLVVWSLLAWFYWAQSTRQDVQGGTRPTLLMEKVSFPAIIFFGFSMTSFIIDWVMALNPHWFSTIFGVYYFAGCMLSALSAMVLLLIWLQQRGRVGSAVNHEHYQDLGKLMFAFTFFWGYIAFSQYMLIWYANMPEETQFFIPRQWEHWAAVSLILLVVHLLIPFPGLLSRHGKRRERVLAFWAVWSICACAVDVCWLVLPNQWINKVPELAAKATGGSAEMLLPNAMAVFADRHDIYHVQAVVPQAVPVAAQLKEMVNFPLTWPALAITALCFIGFGGLYVCSTMLALRGRPLVPVNDPRLHESLAFENI
jgi:hypothetical protein